MKETILQFGTGNFLRGFVDDFIDKMNKKGLYDGKVVIVSPTNSSSVEKINNQNGIYNLILRGLENGKTVYERTEIRSVSRAINPYTDFNGYLKLSSNPDLRFIISNTTEAGIAFDVNCKFSDSPPASFPAKLTRLLFERYKANLDGFIIIACELIDNNASLLKEYVLDYAQLWNLDPDFVDWIRNENKFCNSLVDRIVTGYPAADAETMFREIGCRDELLDTAEPYHLWVIEGGFESELPLQKAGLNVIFTDNVEPYKKMKVRILNGSHTSLVFPSLLYGIETVRESLEDILLSEYLHTCLYDYILPTLGATDQNSMFASAVLERFRNPYINHLWKSISLNSVSKYTARVLPTVSDYYSSNNALPKPLVFSLACLIYYYKTCEPADNQNTISFMKDHSTNEILNNTEIWGSDLSYLKDFVNECLEQIETNGIREAIVWSMS